MNSAWPRVREGLHFQSQGSLHNEAKGTSPRGAKTQHPRSTWGPTLPAYGRGASRRWQPPLFCSPGLCHPDQALPGSWRRARFSPVLKELLDKGKTLP